MSGLALLETFNNDEAVPSSHQEANPAIIITNARYNVTLPVEIVSGTEVDANADYHMAGRAYLTSLSPTRFHASLVRYHCTTTTPHSQPSACGCFFEFGMVNALATRDECAAPSIAQASLSDLTCW